jgi:hypothetical protein
MLSAVTTISALCQDDNEQEKTYGARSASAAGAVTRAGASGAVAVFPFVSHVQGRLAIMVLKLGRTGPVTER